MPLTEAALHIVARMPKVENSPFIFAAATGGLLSDMSLTQVMRRMKVDAVPHGFRSTFRDWAGERTHHPRALMKDWETFVGKPPDERSMTQFMIRSEKVKA